MKKILYVMPLLAMALNACDPSEIEGGSEWSQFDINQLQATTTPQEVNGMNGNVIHVVSNSPVVTAWDADQLIENKRLLFEAAKCWDLVNVAVGN